jgi:hypothetical protein
MSQLKKNFTWLMSALIGLMIFLIILAITLASNSAAAQRSAGDASVLTPPVSLNALMVTLVDHSAHYIWDYGTMQRKITPDEWRTIEYYAIQLAGSASLITVGGSGPLDAAWVEAPEWTKLSQDMMDAAMLALDAAKSQDQAKLLAIGGPLVDSCESCHEAFKPGLPTEGIAHQPDYDYLYHLFR